MGRRHGVKRFLGRAGALDRRRRVRACRGGQPASLGVARAALLLGLSAPLFVVCHADLPRDAGRPGVCSWLLLGRATRRGRPGRRNGAARSVGADVVRGEVRVRWAAWASRPGAADRAGRVALVRAAIPSACHYAAFHWQTYGDLTPYAVNLVYAGSGTPELLAPARRARESPVSAPRAVGRSRLRPRAVGADPGAGVPGSGAGRATAAAARALLAGRRAVSCWWRHS